MILVFEVAFASLAIILGILSLGTLRAIRHLGVGRSFWAPVFVSSVIFSVGSIVTIFHEVNFSLMTRTEEVIHISRLLALSILVCGVYSYSRRVKDNLKKRFSVPKKEEAFEIQAPEEGLKIEAPIQESQKKITTLECKHQLGYLRTLPRNAPIPDECLSCDKIIKCKHFLGNAIEKHASD